MKKKVLSLILALAMVCSLVLPAWAANTKEAVSFTKIDNGSVKADLSDRAVDAQVDAPKYSSSDVVRVSIVLEGSSTIGAGYSTSAIAGNNEAMAYRASLKDQQAAMEKTISKQVLNGKQLDVVWNLTLAANIISANVAYGKIEAIKAIDGVKDVFVETQYEPDETEVSADPNMATSSEMIGSTAAYLNGYTGAGARIAIVDTGTDTDHQSFNADAYKYSLEQNAKAKGMTYDEYVDSLDLLDVAEITKLLPNLNIAQGWGNKTGNTTVTASDLYHTAKLPFGYNYVDHNLEITHDKDTEGEHGSHVAGISTANTYIKNGEGYDKALDTVFVQGVAPDAQLITLKVFGAGGGAYDSDYMAAIEDAIILGCDSVNLSLGSGNAGSTSAGEYQAIMDALTRTDTVVVMSAGNSYGWADYVANGVPYLYNTDVNLDTAGSPGSYTNSFTVASVDNAGTTGNYFSVGELKAFFAESSGYTNQPIATLDKSSDGNGTEYEYVLFENTAVDGEGNNLLTSYADVAKGKVVYTYRGTSSFYQKHMASAEVGAIASIVCNNQPGIINMDLSDSTATIPCVSILQSDAEAIKAASKPVYAEDGKTVLYYTGKMTIGSKMGTAIIADHYTMSDFSSWGVPGTLELKPEITAPGGSIYSVNGAVAGGTAYEQMSGTSMAAPQVTGMAAIVKRYIEENGLKADGLTARGLAQSLLMSTAEPVVEAESGSWYSVLKQGAGLANVGNAVSAESYIKVNGQDDGKVKVELKDDPSRTGSYSASFSINNLTKTALEYMLSADFFTQAIANGGDALYMHKMTEAIDATAVWTVNGKPVTPANDLSAYDFDGDGDTDKDDAQALLDVITGARKAIENADKADLNGSGKLDTADVTALLKLISAATVTVPANGKIDVTVTFALTDAQKADFNTYYPNGAYIEGYLFAEPVATAEGVQGVTHSIPVLGFYGNWSDASMYDVGTLADFWYGTETRLPYLPDPQGDPEMFTNYLSIAYAGESGEYYYFGNPLLDDDEYVPERNGFNNINGDVLSKYYFSNIRNAANAKFTISDVDTGKVYMEQELGEVDAAFYYVNGSAWQSTQKSLNLGWRGTDAEGNKLPEGTRVNISLTLAPELYVKADGTTDWNALGKGASLSTMTTIDNTAPEITSVYRDMLQKRLIIAAQDNQYISVIAVFDENGKDLVSFAPNQENPGTAELAAFDLSKVDNERLIVQVYDYAMNVSTYKLVYGESSEAVTTGLTLDPTELEMMKGGSATITATTEPWEANDKLVWTTSDAAVATVSANGVVTATGKGSCTITATSTLAPEISATCTVTVKTLEKTLNGLVWDEDGEIWWSEFSLANLPNYTKLSTTSAVQQQIASATYGADGKLYAASIDTDTLLSNLYSIDPATYQPTLIGGSTQISYMDLAPTYSLGDGLILAVYGPYVVMVNTATGEYQGVWNWSSSNLVGIAYYGTGHNTYYDQDYDMYLLLDSDGNVYQEAFIKVGTQYAYFIGEAEAKVGNFGSIADVPYFQSLYFDGQYLYWSNYVEAKNNVTMFACDFEGEGNIYNVGSFNDGVWPVGGLFQLNSASSNASRVAELAGAKINADGIASTEIVPLEKTAAAVKGGLNAVTVETAKAEKPETPNTATVTITADEAVSNGLYELTYDAKQMELVSVQSNIALHSVNATEGKIVFGFATDGVLDAKTVLATVTFQNTKDTTKADLTVSMPETDKEAEKLSVEFSHKLIAVAAKEPTRTEPGNIAYWKCENCGKLFRDAEGKEEITLADTVIPALGGCFVSDFTDCDADWYHEAVDFAVAKGLMQGEGNGKFNPAGSMTRAMVVTVLYRMAGSPAVTEPSTFKDVPTNMWYSDAIAWAQDNGAVNGVSDDMFAPNLAVTREQIATILWRYENKPKADAELSTFKDAKQISDYATEAMTWAVAEGIFVGDNGNLKPTASATRAEFSCIVMRYLDGSYNCPELKK